MRCLSWARRSHDRPAHRACDGRLCNRIHQASWRTVSIPDLTERTPTRAHCSVSRLHSLHAASACSSRTPSTPNLTARLAMCASKQNQAHGRVKPKKLLADRLDGGAELIARTADARARTRIQAPWHIYLTLRAHRSVIALVARRPSCGVPALVFLCSAPAIQKDDGPTLPCFPTRINAARAPPAAWRLLLARHSLSLLPKHVHTHTCCDDATRSQLMWDLNQCAHTPGALGQHRSSSSCRWGRRQLVPWSAGGRVMSLPPCVCAHASTAVCACDGTAAVVSHIRCHGGGHLRVA